MINKDTIIENVQFLLDSANQRNTNQGKVVYEGSIKMLREASTREEVKEVLDKLYRSLSGIEAHGYFTDKEFEIVVKIRQICELP